MKKQDPKQATTTSAELEKQAAELARRLTELEAEERSLDGLADFERVAVLAGQRSALAKALDLANERIGEARKAEKRAAEAAAEVAKTERKLTAIAAARSPVVGKGTCACGGIPCRACAGVSRARDDTAHHSQSPDVRHRTDLARSGG